MNLKPPEAVNQGGQTYYRQSIYSVRLYPNKVGRLSIDPVRVKLAVPFQRPSFLGINPLRTVTVTARKVTIMVMPLPAEGVPRNFTGLVGEHDFNFKLNKDKFVVNEVAEGRFEITGEGLLEDFEPPPFYEHQGLENFDTRSDIAEIDNKTARKTFDYTFIPRAGLALEERVLSLGFFNPETGRYYEKDLALPPFLAAGASSPNTAGATPTNNPEAEPLPENAPPERGFSIMGPVPLDESFFIFRNMKFVNLALGFVVVIILLSSIDRKAMTRSRKRILLEKIRRIQKKGVTYSNLYDLLATYYGRELSAREMINKSPLSTEAKTYFKKILDGVGHEFAKEKVQGNIEIKSKYFKELLR